MTRTTCTRRSVGPSRRSGGMCLGVVAAVLLACPGCGDGSDGGATGPGGDEPGGGFAVGDDLRVEVEPSAAVFGAVVVGETDTRDVFVTHVGTEGTLEVRDVALKTESPDLTLEGPPQADLAPGEAAVWTVVYTPSDGDADVAVLALATNAVGGAELAVDVTAPAPTALVTPTPATLAFGGVVTGTSAEMALSLRNPGTLPATVETLALTGDAPGDFEAVGGLPSTPRTLEPGGSLDVPIRYTPTALDADSAELLVTWRAALTGGAEGQALGVPLTGAEHFPVLAAAPLMIDFGLRPAGVEHELPLLVTNDGTSPLALPAVTVEGDTEHATSVWVTGPAEVDPQQTADEAPTLLAPGETWTYSVRWSPREDVAPAETPLATLRFVSDDPAGDRVVDVYGKRLGVGLEIWPPDLLPFGYVPLGATVAKDATVYNAGTAAVQVDRVSLEGPFALFDIGDAAWDPTQPDAVPAFMGPGELRDVTLTFTHDGASEDGETVWGKLNVESQDPANPLLSINLNATGVEAGACLVVLEPPTLDLGFVTPGQTVEAPVVMRNVGPNVCRFHSAATYDCGSSTVCDVPPSEDLGTGDGEDFTVVAESLPAVDAELAPGATLEVLVRFIAPETTSETALWLTGHLRVRFEADDPDTGEPALAVIPAPSPSGTVFNLEARVARGELVVDPPDVGFGVVPVGCKSPPHVLTLRNEGLAPLTLTGWSLEGCPPTVAALSAPPADQDVTLVQGQLTTLELQYTPADAVTEGCSLVLTSSLDDFPPPGEEAGPTVVPIVGSGAFEATWTDTFDESPPQVVDVLFVVDDSGSMNQEQQNLANSFEAFVQKAAEWGADFQIGVTTTTIDFPDGGALQGTPPFVTAFNWEKFLVSVGVGTTGSGTEQGFWAARIGTSAPLTDATDEPCGEDGDCSSFVHVCHPDGLCGGRNRGFVRPGAALELVFVSDEDDQSPETLAEYLTFFAGIKGPDHPELFHAHAIVGPPGGCDSVNGVASEGLRYRQLALDTGGVVASICDLDFSKSLDSIGEVAFAATMTYELTQAPVPTTISVMVDGVPCPPLTGGQFNWTYDTDSNSVSLAEDGLCTAKPGELVSVTYELLCWQAVDSP